MLTIYVICTTKIGKCLLISITCNIKINQNEGREIMDKQKRFGVIFSGGTSAGMNATLEYLCRYSNREGAKLIGFRYGWLGLIQNDTVNVTIENTRGIAFHSGGDFLGSCSKVNVFNHKGKDYSEVCYQTYKALRLDGIYVLGGDGTNRQANELNEKFTDMKFIWISGTLDRDVPGCDDTIGFHTAVENAAEVIASMVSDGKTMHRHVIIECMGRNTGLVSLYATDWAIRKKHVNIDMVMVPEIPFDLPAICNKIEHAAHPLAIVISEGITDPLMEETVKNDAFGPSQDATQNIVGHHADLAYTCRKLKAVLDKHSNLPIKSAVVGYVQRTGKISSIDIYLAENCSRLAVAEALTQGESKAIVFKNGSFKSVPMKQLAVPKEESAKLKQKAFMSDAILPVLYDQISAASFGKFDLEDF